MSIRVSLHVYNVYGRDMVDRRLCDHDPGHVMAKAMFKVVFEGQVYPAATLLHMLFSMAKKMDTHTRTLFAQVK